MRAAASRTWAGSGTIGATFATALLNAAKANYTCTIPMPTSSGKPIASDKVNVGTQKIMLPYVESSGSCVLNAGEGWYYDNLQAPTTLMLCSRSCQLRPARTYRVEVGCEVTRAGP